MALRKPKAGARRWTRSRGTWSPRCAQPGPCRDGPA